MTVEELIIELQKLDPTLEVYLNGYEGGYDDLREIEPIHICRDFYIKEWYYGNHEKHDMVSTPSSYTQSRGILLNR
jgi:hypothetical protein